MARLNSGYPKAATSFSIFSGKSQRDSRQAGRLLANLSGRLSETDGIVDKVQGADSSRIGGFDMNIPALRSEPDREAVRVIVCVVVGVLQVFPQDCFLMLVPKRGGRTSHGYISRDRIKGVSHCFFTGMLLSRRFQF